MWDKPRQHERVSIMLEAVWESASGKHNARMSDISMGGCYIDTIQHVTVGENVLFSVHLPTGHWIQVRGEVAHHFAGVGFGLRFINLTDEDKVLIAEVIRAHGGKVEEPSGATGAGLKESPLPPRPASNRVLVADDDPTIRQVAGAVIGKEGYLAVSVRDGREAYHTLQADASFAAAIFDMVMPHMNGLELVRHIRREKRLNHIPVGIITAEEDPKLWQDSLAAGAGIFLPKPFTPAQMRYMLRVLISQSGVARKL